MIRTFFLFLILATPLLAQSPHGVVEPVGLADCRWTSGFWAERFAVTKDSLLPAMTSLMNGTDRSHFLQNFRIAAGLAEGKHRGPGWNDGDTYKWLEAVAATYAITKDDQLKRVMDDAIAGIAKAQRADGYLHTPVLIAIRNGQDAKPFQDRLAFEMYNFGHLFTAACVHHEATGERTLLNVAEKAAEFLRLAFENPSPELARNSVCPSHYMGTLDLYRTTADKKYLRLAEKFVNLRDIMIDGSDDNQDRIPFRKQTEAIGHAVRANYLYAGAADLIAETGDETLRQPLNKIWTNLVSKKLYITGGCGALYDGASPDGSKEQKTISRTHQAYGRDYQLPNSTAHNETCAAIGSVLWNDRMLRLSGDAKHAELLEHTLYNAVLAGLSLDGKQFFYTNTLRQLDVMPTPLRWSRQREEWISCYCCPPNVARILAEASRFSYGRSTKGVWVHQYGSNALSTKLRNGQPVKLTQQTAYPWDSKVQLKLESAGEFSLFLRIPSWAVGATLTVNGNPVPASPATYAEVHRNWAPGDVVELNLPMRVRLLESHPLVEETRNHIAVIRGPIVYCLESPDLAKGVRVPTVRISANATFTPKHDPKLLHGVTFLGGTGESHSDNWGNELYRERNNSQPTNIELRLIPYFAWANRGKSEMSVWLPLGR